MNFWEKVRAYANKRVREAWAKEHHCEYKCRCCKLWNSELGGWKRSEGEGNGSDFFISQCKQCLQWTRWDMRNGMFAIYADNQPRVFL